MPIKLISVVGARPNFMKIAPIAAAIDQTGGFTNLLVHTGQHYDEKLSRIFFDELGIPKPDVNLGIGSGTREEQIEKIMNAFEPLVLSENPDAILVVGDVNSTIACARVAKTHGVKVIHVEAGLRSFDKAMPEEHNRVATDKISDYLFVTEQSGMDNLAQEQVPGRRFLVGNVMIDNLVRSLPKVSKSTIRESLGLQEQQYLVATFHRPSNVDKREDLDKLIDTLEQLCQRTTVVLPLHPRTRQSMASHGLTKRMDGVSGLVTVDPLGYLDFLRLVTGALGVVTDSGGIQEETTYLGIPCLTMRENTERPITIDVGTNVLIGADRQRLLSELDQVIAGTFKSGAQPPLWDGLAAPRIVEILRNELGAEKLT